jgi:hypothetical protein
MGAPPQGRQPKLDGGIDLLWKSSHGFASLVKLNRLAAVKSTSAIPAI